MKPDKVTVTCPHCGQTQLEPQAAYSTVCRHCHQHFRLQEAPRPAPKRAEEKPEQKEVTCFQCGTLLHVAVEAQSTMCKRCSTHVDLCDYQIDQAVSKNFRTHGTFVIGEKGYVFNTEALVGDAVIKGRFLGKLVARRSLTFYSTAEFRGTFQTEHLVIPSGNRFYWKDELKISSAEIAGELVANLQSGGTVRLTGTGKMFGNVSAANLVVQSGAVLVGEMRIEPKPSAPG